jgi:tRNA C32,U32 (ribose-2'-O)-methylase TrmJ
VGAEAVVAAQHAADVDSKSKVLPQVKSALTRVEVRQAAAQANRAGLPPRGELSY